MSYRFLTEVTSIDQLSDEVAREIDQEHWDRAFPYLHDLIIRLVLRYKWFEERYGGETDEFASDLAAYHIFQVCARGKVHKGKWKNLNTPKSLGAWRSRKENRVDDFSRIRRNPNAMELFDQVNGYTEDTQKEVRIFEQYESLRFIKKEQVFDYVIDHYCLYDEYSVIHRYLAISLMMTISRKSITLYRLSPGWKVELKFLLKQFVRIYRKCLKDGWYLVDA